MFTLNFTTNEAKTSSGRLCYIHPVDCGFMSWPKTQLIKGIKLIVYVIGMLE